MQLSVLDLVPVRSDQSTGDAIAASRSLARVADELGFERYWVAEHHNMPAVAATNPPLLISLLAAATARIRVGSGGVMLPNHAPLVVAEQFALLEAAFPGRIDLGIGRAPGTDPVTRYVLRNGLEDDVSQFPAWVDNVIALMAPDGAGITLAGRTHALNATPRPVSTPPVWLLGSSDYSARLAADRGLPYVFAHHFAGQGTAEALAAYRSGFRPSAHLSSPRTFLTVNAVVASTQEEAEELALPQLQAMVALRTGGPLQPQRLVSEAQAHPIAETHRPLVESMKRRWVIGTAAAAAARIGELAEELGVDEVMVHPVAGALPATPADATPAREETLRLLARELLD